MKNQITPNLLLVDDNLLIIDVIQNLFKNSKKINLLGHCKDGSEVMLFVKRSKIDVILMDIVMKNVDGIEAIKEVKKNNPEIKIVGFSVKDNREFIKEVMNAGADGFISKYEMTGIKLESEILRVLKL